MSKPSKTGRRGGKSRTTASAEARDVIAVSMTEIRVAIERKAGLSTAGGHSGTRRITLNESQRTIDISENWVPALTRGPTTQSRSKPRAAKSAKAAKEYAVESSSAHQQSYSSSYATSSSQSSRRVAKPAKAAKGYAVESSSAYQDSYSSSYGSSSYALAYASSTYSQTHSLPPNEHMAYALSGYTQPALGGPSGSYDRYKTYQHTNYAPVDSSYALDYYPDSEYHPQR